MADFQNISVQSLYAVLLRYINYVDKQSYQAMHQLLVQPSNFFFFQLALISWMVTLSSCLIWQIISFILPQNEYGCVYAWTTLESIDLQKMPILANKKSSFQTKLILLLAGMPTSKIVAFGVQKTRTHTLKSRHTQNESLLGANYGPEA